MSDIDSWKSRVDTYWYGKVVVIGDEIGFRLETCCSCGAGGGERFDLWWAEMSDWDVYGTGDVCLNCAMYLANGDLPDDTLHS